MNTKIRQPVALLIANPYSLTLEGLPLKDLPNTKNNLMDLHRILEDPQIGEVSTENIYWLIEPSKGDLDRIFKKISKKNPSHLFLYWGGHGQIDGSGNQRELYLLNSRTGMDGEDLQNSITPRTLMDRITANSFNNCQVFFLLDVCGAKRGMAGISDLIGQGHNAPIRFVFGEYPKTATTPDNHPTRIWNTYLVGLMLESIDLLKTIVPVI